MTTITTLSGKPITSMYAIKNNGLSDGQGSGTKESWFLLNGEKVFIRKHWSNEGASVTTDEALTNYIGQILEENGVLTFEPKINS